MTLWPGAMGCIVARGGRPAWARRAPARAARRSRAASRAARVSARHGATSKSKTWGERLV
eukprot:1410752-Prymnesium_polylepis.1